MSRKGIDKKGVFSTKAEVYQGRPQWPDAAFTVMLVNSGFNPLDEQEMKNLVAIDVGAGTGDTTFPLADLGCTVLAVEPNDSMRSRIEFKKKEEGYDNVIVVSGEAFSLNIPKEFRERANLIYSGNSPHWWSSRMPGNPAGAEKRAVSEWSAAAAPDARACIMYMRVLESDVHVKELRELMVKHFKTIAGSPTEFGVTRLFSVDAFSDYFNHHAGCPEVTETYGNFDYCFRDFEHFKQWLLSFSYMPNDAFKNTEAVCDFQNFFEKSSLRGKGTAAIKQGLRIYTGPLNRSPC